MPQAYRAASSRISCLRQQTYRAASAVYRAVERPPFCPCGARYGFAAIYLRHDIPSERYAPDGARESAKAVAFCVSTSSPLRGASPRRGSLAYAQKSPPCAMGRGALLMRKKSPPCAREGGSRQADGRVVRHRLSSISALNAGRLLRIMSWLTQVDSRRYPGQPNGSHGGTRMLYSFAFSENSSAVPNGALMSI